MTKGAKAKRDESDGGERTEGEREEAGSPRPAKSPRSLPGVLRDWWNGKPLSRDASIGFGLVLPAAVLGANLWRVRSFTVDDAYISYRYARNFARGLGLVYNAGERIEGYTNFLWTILLAAGIKVGFEADHVAKVLGALSAFGALWMTFDVAWKLRTFRTLPCIATWLLASSILFSGYAVFGLETPLFTFLVLAGISLFLRETDGLMRGPKARAEAPVPTRLPLSGLVFALAGLTRPEAPLYLGVFMLFLGIRHFFGRQNLLRGAFFVVPILAHLLFRKAYYGAFLPNTLTAKTGDFGSQVPAGWDYVSHYFAHVGPLVWLSLLGIALAVTLIRRDVLAIAVLAALHALYVVSVGGDWMPHHRFLAPCEPLLFLLIDYGVRWGTDRRERAPNLALAIFVALMIPFRATKLREAQATFLVKEKRFWDRAAGGTAKWLLQNEPGQIAIGDIGYVGYATDYPVLDLLGLVDPVIANLPGGYTRKLGPGFNDRFFDVNPKYMLIISASQDCKKPSVPGSQAIFRDPRFRRAYELGGTVPLEGNFAWCVYRRKAE